MNEKHFNRNRQPIETQGPAIMGWGDKAFALNFLLFFVLLLKLRCLHRLFPKTKEERDRERLEETKDDWWKSGTQRCFMRIKMKKLMYESQFHPDKVYVHCSGAFCLIADVLKKNVRSDVHFLECLCNESSIIELQEYLFCILNWFILYL